MRDVPERAEEVRVNQALLSLIYEAVSDVIYLLAVEPDDCYRFLSVNRAFFAATGLEADQVIGKRIEDVLPPSSHEVVINKYRQAIREKQRLTWEEEAAYPAGVRVGQVTVAPIMDDAGRCTHLLGSVRDITELRVAEVQLRQAQKMEAIGQLAGAIAHDFNNILSVILMCCELRAQELGPDDPFAADLAEIKKAGERAAELTRQLLAFSRQQVIRPRILDLNDVVANLDRMIRRLVREDSDLSVKPAADLGKVRADPGQIEQVIINLVVNASDAMPFGGTLTIETGNVELDETYAEQHRGATAGPHVMLAVSDTGVGMDRATQERIFEPFFTTKERGHGTGLGLATVFGIVKQNGGNIWVYSEPAHGTTFKVYLPRKDETEAVDQVSAPIAAHPGGSETILLVEDYDQLRVIARRILVRSGYRVLEAHNGTEALLLFEQHGAERIDLLLTDVIMPQMSGKELANRLLLQRPALRILYMSGYTDNTIVQHGILEPGVALLEKPITPERLLRKVREVLQ